MKNTSKSLLNKNPRKLVTKNHIHRRKIKTRDSARLGIQARIRMLFLQLRHKKLFRAMEALAQKKKLIRMLSRKNIK